MTRDMTKEEVLNILYEIREDNFIPGDACAQDKYEAIEMAIIIMEQESKTDILDRISAELIQSIQNGILKIESGNEELFRIIDKYKAEVEL